MSKRLAVPLLVALVIAGCGTGSHTRKARTEVEGTAPEGTPPPGDGHGEPSGDDPAAPAPQRQLRGFLLPLLIEYDVRLAGPSWVGVQLSLGPTLQLREPDMIGGGAGAVVLYRWQTPVRSALGFSASAGGGLGMHSVFDGDRPPFAGVQLQAGAEVRYAYLSAGLDVIYLTPFFFGSNSGGFTFAGAHDSRFVLVPRLALVFAF
jgi:hypothetical protein